MIDTQEVKGFRGTNHGATNPHPTSSLRKV
jgi:hypothetical protein